MNPDQVGIRDLLKIHKEKMDQIKFNTRIDNERYLREHPELEFIIENFLVKLLQDRPVNTLTYAGEYFNKTDFRNLYECKMKQKDTK